MTDAHAAILLDYMEDIAVREIGVTTFGSKPALPRAC
ncbi:hypothetical protein J2802_003080 [Paraburkholderia caribensis]|jgi:hypothetical protein|nr:hypothetical protein [Paraburkholderia caribensis]